MLVRIQCHVNLRVPPQGSSTEGESRPKIQGDVMLWIQNIYVSFLLGKAQDIVFPFYTSKFQIVFLPT